MSTSHDAQAFVTAHEASDEAVVVRELTAIFDAYEAQNAALRLKLEEAMERERLGDQNRAHWMERAQVFENDLAALREQLAGQRAEVLAGVVGEWDLAEHRTNTYRDHYDVFADVINGYRLASTPPAAPEAPADVCPNCTGTTWEGAECATCGQAPSAQRLCKACGGHRMQFENLGFGDVPVDCRACNGTGHAPGGGE